MVLPIRSSGPDFFCGGVLSSNQTSAASNTTVAAAAASGTGYWDNNLKVSTANKYISILVSSFNRGTGAWFNRGPKRPRKIDVLV